VQYDLDEMMKRVPVRFKSPEIARLFTVTARRDPGIGAAKYQGCMDGAIGTTNRADNSVHFCAYYDA
jgi:hypothetical protein